MIRIAIALVFIVSLHSGIVVHAQAPGGTVAVCPVCGIPDYPPCPPCYSQGCFGQCMAPGGPNMCFGKGCSQGDGTTDSTAGGMQALQDLIGKVLQGLGGGGGGGGGGMPPSSFDPSLYGQKQVDPNTTGALFDAANSVSSNDVNDLGNTDRSRDRVNTLLNAFDEKNAAGQAQNTGTTTENGGATDSVKKNSPAEYESVADTVRGQAHVNAEAEARAQKEAEARLAAENARDAQRGGLAGIIDDLLTSGRKFFDNELLMTRSTFLVRLCTSKPWESSFLAQFFPNTFFQTLCARRGVETPASETTTHTGVARLTCTSEVFIGEPATIQWDCSGSVSSSDEIPTNGASSGSVELLPEDSETYRLACGNGGVTSCAINVKKPRVQLIAYPERVPLGARAKIYWVSEHADECVVRGPSFEERGVRGVATTAAVLDRVTFTAVCTRGGYSVEKNIVVDVGE